MEELPQNGANHREGLPDSMEERIGLTPISEAAPQSEVVQRIIKPDTEGRIDLQLPTVWQAIFTGATVGAAEYVRTHPESRLHGVSEMPEQLDSNE